MGAQPMMVALPKATWSKLRPMADRRATMPSRVAAELVRRAIEQGLVEAILDGKCEIAQPKPKPKPKPKPVVRPVAKAKPCETRLSPVSTRSEPSQRRGSETADVVLDIIDRARTEAPVRTTPRPRPPVRREMPQRAAKAPLPRDYPEIPFHLRKRNIEGASAHLKRHGVLVDVVDRDALVRRYRVTGQRDLLLAEGVVEIACEHGFEVIR